MGVWQEHKDRLKKFLDRLTNDAHIPIALFVFCVTFAYCAKTGKDIPPGFVSSLYAFYGFLGGHALVYQKWPDPTAPTVDVNVNNDNTNSANANVTPPAPAPAPAPAAPNADTGSGG